MQSKTLLLLGALLTLTSFTPPLRVLFVGDSLTCYRGGWQHGVATALGNSYSNISQGGKRLEWMKLQLDGHLRQDSLYSTVYIYGGCNDAFSSVSLDLSVKWTQMMVDTCVSRGIKPVVILGYDPERVMLQSPYDAVTTRRARERYKQLQSMMATSLRGCHIVPVDTTVSHKDTGDGIHLGASGHRKFALWVLKHL